MKNGDVFRNHLVEVLVKGQEGYLQLENDLDKQNLLVPSKKEFIELKLQNLFSYIQSNSQFFG